MKAHELLDSPEKWTQGAWVRDKNGKPCDIKNAVSFCAIGAIDVCHPDYSGWSPFEAMRHAIRIGVGSISQWNDAPERTFEEVRAALIKADV